MQNGGKIRLLCLEVAQYLTAADRVGHVFSCVQHGIAINSPMNLANRLFELDVSSLGVFVTCVLQACSR